MLELMTDPATAEPVGIHRTFLLADGCGKAPGKPKMKAGNAGMIRLTADSALMLGLGLAEGVETALAIMQCAGWCPVWAAGDAGSMAAFPVLAGLEPLTLFVDHDSGTGLRSAPACSDRWRNAGREVTLQLPPHGADWHDALIGCAA